MKFSSKIGFVILLGSSILFSIAVYVYVATTISSEQTQIIRVEQIFALTAITFIYLALISKPLCLLLSNKKFEVCSSIQKACIVSATYFGLLHGSLAFFGQLGGFEGLGFLNGRYLLAVVLSFSALLMLCLLAIISLWFKSKLSVLHVFLLNKLLYIVGISIVIHAVMLGTHFQDLSSSIPQILFWGVAILLLLEALRLDTFLNSKFSTLPQFGISFVLIVGVIFGSLFSGVFSENSLPSLSIHSQHIQLAKQAQQNTVSSNFASSRIPGLTGDRTRRFSVDIDAPEKITPHQEVTVQFRIYDASSGNKVVLFDRVYEKFMHLIIVDQNLSYFSHIHPDLNENVFSITTTFPKDGTYHVYLDFQPLGAIEQQFAFTLPVGLGKEDLVDQKFDTNLTKTFGNYEVSLVYTQPLLSSQLSIGQQELTFILKDAHTNKPITTLKPYLGSFGHLVMINQKTYDYLHVHPANLTVPKPDENGGPEVAFLPLGLYGPIKPGTYKIFAQFNPDKTLFTADFMVEIQ